MAENKKLRPGTLVYTFSKKTNWDGPRPLARQVAILIKPIKMEMYISRARRSSEIKDGWLVFSTEDGRVRRTNRYLLPIK
jgi:hypothetical protein